MKIEPFAEIVRRYQAGVCAVAYGVTGDRALSEDIAQDTFLAAWRGASTLRDPSRLRGWLHGIARNLAHKARRRRRPIALGDGSELAATGDPAQAAAERDDARLAWEALRALPAVYREALVLYYWEDESARAVAEALGISEAAAMQRLSRGRALVREEIQRQVEATLRRARPGAAITTAILAAIAATTASTARAAAAPGRWHRGHRPRGGRATAEPHAPARAGVAGVSRRAIWKAGLAVAVLRALGLLGVRPGARSPRPGVSDLPRPTTAEEAVRAGAPPRGSLAADAAAAPAVPPPPVLAGADEPSIGDPMMATVTGEDGPADWAAALLGPLSTCFVDELVDRPCRIAVEVRDGTIAAATVEPFDGADGRLVVRTLEPTPAVLAPDQVRSWVAADRLIHAIRDPAAIAGRAEAMSVGGFVALCARARLEGLSVGGPDGTRHVRFGWTPEILGAIDREAYVDLGVAAGPSRGPASAPVTVVSFLDIAHPWGFGRQSLAAWCEVLARYPRDVRLVVKLCPLSPDHQLVAEAVHAAGAQGGFWPMLDRVAASWACPTLDDLVACAGQLDLDARRLRADLERGGFRDAVELDQDQQRAMEIDSLPSALVNGQRVHGALPAATCLAAVEHALQRARGATATPAPRRS